MINPISATSNKPTTAKTFGRKPLTYNNILSDQREKQLEEWEAHRKSQGRGIK